MKKGSFRGKNAWLKTVAAKKELVLNWLSLSCSSNKPVQKILLEEFPHKYVQYVLNSSIDFQSFFWIVKTSKGKIPVRATN